MGYGVITAKGRNAAYRHGTLVGVQAAGSRLTQRQHQGEERHEKKHSSFKESLFLQPDHIEILISGRLKVKVEIHNYMD
jgi:hypothetical protein